MRQHYVVLDLEMTGLNAKRDKIIEIGAVRVKDGQLAGTYRTLVNPGRSLTEPVKQLTGIQDEDLKDAPYIDEVMKDFLSFAGTECLVGHSILFDYSFLKRAAVNLGYSFERDGIDTLKIARKCLKDLPCKSLPSLCSHFGIAYAPHRALEDAMAAYHLYQRLCMEFEKGEYAACFEPKPLIYKVKKESPATKIQIRQIMRLLENQGLTDFYTKPDSPQYVNIDKLTRNEASRFVDTILHKKKV